MEASAKNTEKTEWLLVLETIGQKKEFMVGRGYYTVSFVTYIYYLVNF